MKDKIFNIASILFGVMFINSGLNKFFGYLPPPPNMPENIQMVMNAFLSIGWIMPLIGAVEVLGGLLVIFKRTRAIGALMIFPIMIGILVFHFATAPEGLPFACVFLAINAWQLFTYKEKYINLIND